MFFTLPFLGRVIFIWIDECDITAFQHAVRDRPYLGLPHRAPNYRSCYRQHHRVRGGGAADKKVLTTFLSHERIERPCEGPDWHHPPCRSDYRQRSAYRARHSHRFKSGPCLAMWQR
jgi:hypothetical protein